ncbi:formate dehydrogenase subunit gamma [Epibacterium sp. SM1969]|uniref:Formate dehydrogenase subunit gamma n=1 Tax=Tritonibacter aquimaris TaxID=2663379 RepID=A0A844ANC7_9RHOB|nr:formate dehydrogenase subunit gamma [Tritonibacter aquimaris]MQY44070.1 formate dehydrogenase subunit gamma [Tritonibacter aquimaris]
MLRIAFALLWAALTALVSVPALAQSTPDRSATGGAQTLDDILARQQQLQLDDGFRRNNVGNPDQAAATTDQLGTLGGVSDSEVWRALRYDTADVRVSAGGDVASVLIQDGGMRWLMFRDGPLRSYGGWLLIGTLGALVVFYLLRGRIGVDGESTGKTVTRFKAIERFAHWMLAGSFILLGVTGLFTLFGRVGIIPLLGHEANSVLLIGGKWIHNNVSWAFMLALLMVFFMWVGHNIPSRGDIVWIKQFGGIIGKNHPPAKKFNAGQKVIFWSVILFGGSIAISGVSLLFPYELPLFAKTFAFLNTTGVPELVGLGTLPTSLAPQEEMQLAQLWHAIVAFVLMAIVIAHIYIGSVGMEGAYDAMGSGEVDEAWAHQHHSIWLEEEKSKAAARHAAE